MADKPSIAHRVSRIMSGVLLLAFAVLLIDTTIDIWPSVGVQSEICKQAEKMPLAEREPFLVTVQKGYKVNCRFKDIAITRVNLGGTHTFLSPDQGLFALVVIFAVLGAIARSLYAMARAAGGRGETGISTSWLVMRPVIGAVLAAIVYVAVRALLLPSATLADVNPYGFIALGALVGLFCGEMFCLILDRVRPASKRSR